MPKRVKDLTAVEVEAIKQPGSFAVSAGLYLQVEPSGARSWIYRFTLGGRREMGLGTFGKNHVTLKKARERVAEARDLVKQGIDPIEERRAKRIREAVENARAMAFKDCARSYIASHQAGWKNAKHAQQWENTLETYVYPVFGDLPVDAVDTGLIAKVLEPIWSKKPETASRVRGRMEAILDWARARGYYRSENPARWRGHLDKLLPKKTKVRRVEHHPALPYNELPGFMTKLRQQDGIGARALEFIILTAARTGEAIGAKWEEINLTDKLWTIPPERMKPGKAHRVPLSDRAIEILEEMQSIRLSGYVFPGTALGRPMNDASLRVHLGRMDWDNLTVHGFRSSFRDWTAECTNFPRDAAEMALAHAVGDAVERAYQRGDLFQKRRQLMNAWARYCSEPQSGKVVPLRKAG